MSQKVIGITTTLLLLAILPCWLAAQPNGAPVKPDSAEVTQHVEKAKKIAGAEWAAEANFFCIAPRANSPNDPPIEPTRIFDNVYVIGNQGTVAYVINTSDG